MTYGELLKELFDLIVKRNPEYDVKLCKEMALFCARRLTEDDEDNKELMDANICPACFAIGFLVPYNDQTVCFECGEVFTEVIS